MQDSASAQKFLAADLYRVCYRCKATGFIGKANGVDTFEGAQKKVYEFNVRYADEFEYFAEPVNIHSIDREQLLRLVNEGKVRLNQLFEHC